MSSEVSLIDTDEQESSNDGQDMESAGSRDFSIKNHNKNRTDVISLALRSSIAAQ